MADEAFDKLLTALRDEMRDHIATESQLTDYRNTISTVRSERDVLSHKVENLTKDVAVFKAKSDRYEALWKAAKKLCDTEMVADLATLRVAVKASAADCDEIPF